MGNVNGREDGNGDDGSPGVRIEVEDEGGESNGGGDGREEAMVTTQAPVLIGHAPPHTAMAARSPLMFTPQVPVAPLERPDEAHIANQSWMQTTSGSEDTYDDEQGIPTMFTWSYGGKEVYVEGSWDNWKMRKALQRSGKDFIIIKVLPSGVYQYRFIVDGHWKYAPELPWTQDDMGQAYNILDLQDYVPEDLESISGFESPQSPDTSYNSMQLGSEDFAKEPPLVPPHLQMTLLNVPPAQMEIPPPLSRPQHVVLNHLYMQKGRSGPSVVALGSTHRFDSKYVTVVLYRSLQR